MPLQIGLEQEEIHDFLRVDLGQDDLVIGVLTDTALVEAETFLNTDFSTATIVVTDQDGTIRSTKTEYVEAVTTPTTTAVLDDTDLSVTTTTTAPATDAPAPVKMWVLNRIAQLYENRGQSTAPDFAIIQPYRVYSFRG